MPEVKKLSLGPRDNYPKAGQTKRAKSVRRTTGRSTKATTTKSAPRDTFQAGHHDPDMAKMEQLRRKAARRPRPSIENEIDYPKAGQKKPPTPSKRKTPTRRRTQAGRPGRTPKRPTRAPRRAPQQPVPQKAPTHGTVDLTPDYPRSGPAPKKFVGNFNRELDIIRAKQSKQAAYEESLKAKKTVNQSKSTKPSSKPRVKTNKKLAAGGGFKAVSGALTIKGGVENLANGNYMEGGIQVAQGGVSFADGVQDINAARQGLSSTSVTKMSKGLNKAGGILNGAMAAYDTKQAYDAMKSGNEVQASEELGSAVINAVSAFPPTAVIGAIGGVADWAMDVSGADDAMVRRLTRGKTEAYNKQIQADVEMARMLMNTQTSRLEESSRSEKKQYIRGINGMRELRQFNLQRGNMQNVQLIDRQMARVKKAWSK